MHSVKSKSTLKKKQKLPNSTLKKKLIVKNPMKIPKKKKINTILMKIPKKSKQYKYISKNFKKKQITRSFKIPSTQYLNNNVPRLNKFEIIENGGGGNCFFMACSDVLSMKGIHVDYKQLRTKVSEYIVKNHIQINLNRNNADPYTYIRGYQRELFLNKSWKEYGQMIGYDGMWVGSMCVKFMNEVFKQEKIDHNIILIDTVCGNSLLYNISGKILISGGALSNDLIDERSVFIMYTEGHFEGMIPIND